MLRKYHFLLPKRYYLLQKAFSLAIYLTKYVAMCFTFFTESHVNLFHKNGYIIIKNFYCNSEVTKMYDAAISQSNENYINKWNINKVDLPSWFSPPDNLFGCMARSSKIIYPVISLLGAKHSVCHVQSKVMEKKPASGGVWGWHQDYAYWETNDFKSSSQMISVMVALTPINNSNGGSQLIKGSHKLPTLEHSFNDEEESTGVDSSTINYLLESMDLVNLVLNAGDAIFFHSNLLHRSGENKSTESCWAAISCYSSMGNQRFKGPFSSWYTPIEISTNELRKSHNVQFLLAGFCDNKHHFSES